MPDIIPFSADILTRFTKYVTTGNVYAIIAANGSYAIANPDPHKGVTVVATHTDPAVTASVTATLLEVSANAGDECATINTKTTGTSLGFERVYCIVCPITAEAKANWYQMYVVPIDNNEMPTAPFLWRLTTMIFNTPTLVRFKIGDNPHIVPAPGSVPMVQMYPMTGPTTTQTGWQVFAYRTDKKGTGQMFKSPPEWSTDIISIFGDRGLAFGKDPPLIAADVPFT